jgi:glutamate dehydrogenase (NADP+)
VAIFAIEKATQLGAKVVTCSDSNGYVYDPNGIDLDVVKDIKLNKRGRIQANTPTVSTGAEYHEGCREVWTVPCDIALPCATQNEIDGNPPRSSSTTAARSCARAPTCRPRPGH